MTHTEIIKLELMIHGINMGFFAYGGMCRKRSDGKYESIVDGEKYIFSGKELASQFDDIEECEQAEIIESFFKNNFNIKNNYLRNY